MPEFNSIQADVTSGFKELESEKKKQFLIREKIRKVQRAKAQVERTKGIDSSEYKSLNREEKKFGRNLAASKTRLAEINERYVGVLQNFDRFTDPRRNIRQFSNEYPILLFPLRIETRFKQFTEDNELKHELWVRVFPDECSIDTFDDIPSESEIEKVKNYWVDLWKTGTADTPELESFVNDKNKGAWKALAGNTNPGRAYWLIQQYRPLVELQMPKRQDSTDLIWVVPTENLPALNVRTALTTYWKSFYSASGDPNQLEVIFNTLKTDLGTNDEDTANLITEFTPTNIVDTPSEPPANVEVAFLGFPKSGEVDSKLNAWSGAAHVTTLPERLVLIGKQEGNPEPVISQLGNRIPNPLIVGPDPGEDIEDLMVEVYGADFEALSEDEKASKYMEYLSTQSETKWLFDFEEAIRIGLGFKVDLDALQYRQGFEKLYVLGVKLSADNEEAQHLLEDLIKHHHFGDSGFSILPQGTPTNNTDDEGSSYSDSEDADESYERYFSESSEEDPVADGLKRDGRWLSELLGIDAENSSLKQSAYYYHKDQCEARAMNTAVWNATMGYFMESMLTPVFNDDQIAMTRWFMTNHVRGRGSIPAIRIGDQPYGILPISTVSNLSWMDDDDQSSFIERHSNQLPYFRGLYELLLKIKEGWEELLDKVAYVGKDNEDGHEVLLQALGLHASSVEFDQRYAQGFDQVYNTSILTGLDPGDLGVWTEIFYKLGGILLLQQLGYVHDTKNNPKIPILEKFFFTKENDVDRPLIDDQPLSEEKPIRSYTDSNENYIEWLIRNARQDHRNIKDQKGFTDNKAPTALLYGMLRHALNLEYSNSGFRLYQNAGVLNQQFVAQARIDAPFIGIESEPATLESKWDYLYRREPMVTRNNNLMVDHISEMLRSALPQSGLENLNEVLGALEHLKDSPTSALERAFVEHLDCCSYRLDAWLLGLVDLQLHHIRYGTTGEAKPGVYLGAYGWVENLRPDNKQLSSVDLSNSDLANIFNPDDSLSIQRDDTNFGYIHAPSINHAQTAAVLRNAYKTNASSTQAEVYKINLSSERVRLALAIIEGLQQGQSMGALLGYQLERGLHDNTALELDIFIYELRKIFSLNSNRQKDTKITAAKAPVNAVEATRFSEEETEFEEQKAITKIEARNVVDGLELLEHIKSSGAENYPFGIPIGNGPDKLMAASGDEAAAINTEVQRLMNIRDAVADLAMAESVHQVVQGNYERASGALETYSKGNYPQTPEVIKSPSSGTSLNHKFGIHLKSGIDPATGTTPRSQAEPALNQWLTDLFPPVNQIGCKAYHTIPVYGEGPENANSEVSVTLENLGLQPIDLLYMLNVESEKNLTALDDYILNFIYATENPRPDVNITIHYREIPDGGTLSLFELAAMIQVLRPITVNARPLRSSDIALQNEATKEQDTSSTIVKDCIRLPKNTLDTMLSELLLEVLDPLQSFIDTEDLEATMVNKDAIIGALDATTTSLIHKLGVLNRFGLPQTGFGHVYDRKAALYGGIQNQVLEYRNRWAEKRNVFDDLINVQLPLAVDDEAMLKILQNAEITISTNYTIPVPDLADYQTAITAKKSSFDAKFMEFENFLNQNFATIQLMVDGVNNLKTDLGNFDSEPLTIEEQERQIVVFVDEYYGQTQKLHTKLTDNSTKVQDLLDAYDATAIPAEQTKLMQEASVLLFGEDFLIIPEFNLTEHQGQEMQNAFAAQSQLLDYQINTLEREFPLDEWLYGVARVREKVGAWETLVMLAEGFKDRAPIDLTAIQLPYKENDTWLGLPFPEEYTTESDKLLYTAYMPSFDPNFRQCGLLVDEWTEIIPTKKETTGLSFNYDQPNNEPPQSMLLVTPHSFSGSWNWQHLVDALDETLDLARLRAIEPGHIDGKSYATFLPATVAASTFSPATIMFDYLWQINENLTS